MAAGVGTTARDEEGTRGYQPDATLGLRKNLDLGGGGR